jgi:hypothetical protein
MAPENEDDQQDNLKGLRKAADEGKQHAAENSQLKRELLFAKAGIDTDTKLGRMLMLTFEGESIEALRAEAEEIGLIKQPGSEAPTGPNQADIEQQQHRRNISAGQPSGGVDNESPHPLDNALRAFHDDVKGGAPSNDAALAAIDRVLVAAASGDKRVIFDSDQWAAQARLTSSSRG